LPWIIWFKKTVPQLLQAGILSLTGLCL